MPYARHGKFLSIIFNIRHDRGAPRAQFPLEKSAT